MPKPKYTTVNSGLRSFSVKNDKREIKTKQKKNPELSLTNASYEKQIIFDGEIVVSFQLKLSPATNVPRIVPLTIV